MRGVGRTVSPTLRNGPIATRPSPTSSNTIMASVGDNISTADLFEKWRKRHLIFVFCAWKGLLLLLSAFCPGPGYDTSGLVLSNPSARRHDELNDASRTDRLTINLLRWDAIYFVKAAERGHIFEQEWAFSWANSHLLRAIEQCEPFCHPSKPVLT